MIKTNPLIFSLNSNNPFKSSQINSNKIDDQSLQQVTKLAFPTGKPLTEKDIARKRAVKAFMGLNKKPKYPEKKCLNLGHITFDIKKGKGKIYNLNKL